MTVKPPLKLIHYYQKFFLGVISVWPVFVILGAIIRRMSMSEELSRNFIMFFVSICLLAGLAFNHFCFLLLKWCSKSKEFDNETAPSIARFRNISSFKRALPLLVLQGVLAAAFWWLSLSFYGDPNWQHPNEQLLTLEMIGMAIAFTLPIPATILLFMTMKNFKK